MRVLYGLCLPLVLCLSHNLSAQSFEAYFLDKTLRVDYYHTGTKGEEQISLDMAYEEGPWPGSKRQLLDPLNRGEYMVRVYDLKSAVLIFSRGYSTIFNEWQTTEEALNGVYRTFHETVRMPMPKQTVQVTISRRDKQMIFHEIFSTAINPTSPVQVNRESRAHPFKTGMIVDNGGPENKVDLVILGDGYGKSDMEKFRKDAKHLTDVLFSTSPFKEKKNHFNVWVIEVESAESGIDVPDKNGWKHTVLGTTYNFFGSPRYVLTDQNRRLRDVAGMVPYDAMAILCNDNRYGGGGIYNQYTTCYTQSDKPGLDWQIDYVFVHELGHSFAGLGDEYYSSQVSYVDFYKKGIEPWEPNVTALGDPNNIKWKEFVAPETPLPTPWDKGTFDSLGAERGKLDRLADDYYEKREPLYQAGQRILKTDPRAGAVGAFEGSGYASQGLYRPAIDCRMFSLSLVDFDPVCSHAIGEMIDYYTE
jgi:hypothetical protein